MTRVLVLGGTGMVGHKLWQVLRERLDTHVTVRGERCPLSGFFDPARTRTGVSVERIDTVEAAIDEVRPTVVVNAIGLIRQHPRCADVAEAVAIDGLFPHRLHRMCRRRGLRLVHISTDCVFSGRRGGYREDDLPDPLDVYGRAKLAGEPQGEGALSLRVSAIGRELRGRRGLLEWVLAQREEAPGYTRAVFNGLTTAALAELVARIVEGGTPVEGLRHAGGEPISKAALLERLSAALGLGLRVVPDATVAHDRSLDPGRLVAETRWSAPSWAAMIEALARDPTPYPALQAEAERTFEEECR
jgi:dTDP-4-dehydrorhamnose reductase